jgi:ABC-type uncharacterized transport system auxiliary subunit
MIKQFRPFIWLFTLVLTGCSGVLTSEQASKQYYTLMPLTGAGGDSGGTGPELALIVSAVPGLDTDRIQALGPDARLNRYANARWPDHLPEVLTSVLKRSLAASGRFSSVEASDRVDGNGWLLRLEVQQFYGRQDAAGRTASVIVEMAGTVGCGSDLRQIVLSESQTVTAERLSAVVAAHQSALDAVTRRLLSELETACGYQGNS